MNKQKILLPVTLIMMLVAIYASLIYAPTVDNEDNEWTAPKAQRLFYFHLPLAITSYLAFFVVFVCGILYLNNKDIKWDIIASSSAEIGVVFCTLAVMTGTIWAKAEWERYWDWSDMKLNTTLVLWMIFIAYQAVRSSIEEKGKRARLSAVYGIIGFAGVPLSYFSFYIWQTVHPTVVSRGGGGLLTEMRTALILSMLAYFVFYFYLLFKRISLEHLNERVEIIEEKLEE